ncbi:MAG: 30S ribosomal protein S12 methylthiotransferase RimO [Thermoanaerobaculia bacterium]
MKKASVIYLGCPKNLVLSEKLLGYLHSSGYDLTVPEEAEVAFLLSCGFIKDAKEETLQNLEYLGDLKKNGKLKKIVFTGCMASFFEEELKKEYTFIDEVISSENMEKFLKKGERILSTKSYGYLKIAEGCDHKCSFCIIPLLTGPFKSRKIEEIVEEARNLEESEIFELILIAQDTSSYGKDLYGKKMLKELLEELLYKTSYPWIRLLYLYPEAFPFEILELMKKEKRILPYFDLPFQHTSKNVLKKMERGGSSKSFIKLIEGIRREIPEAIIRSTFLLGFPGEGEEDLNELKNFLKQTKMDRVGFFIYSDEPESMSFHLDGKIPKAIAKKRLMELAKIQRDISLKKHKKLIGKKIPFLLEEKRGRYGYGRLLSQAPEIDGFLRVEGLPENFKGIGLVEIKRVSPYNFFGRYYENSK